MNPSPPSAVTTRLNLSQRLQAGPLVMDGAMGTLLNERGIPFNECFELANVDRRALVAEVHRAFLNAGAQGLHTNTFGLNRFRLSNHGLPRRLSEFAEAAANVAREVAGVENYVIASLGPTGIAMEPIGRVAKAEVRQGNPSPHNITSQWAPRRFNQRTSTTAAARFPKNAEPNVDVECPIHNQAPANDSPVIRICHRTIHVTASNGVH